MAELSSEDKRLVSDQLIRIIKYNGECVSDGYRIKFQELLSGLGKSKLPADLGGVTITESNIFGFFRDRSNMKVGLRADGDIHWLYVKPSSPIIVDDIKAEAQTVIDSIKKAKGTDASGKCSISVKELGEALSNRIVFLEYLLRKNNLSARDFIKQLSEEQISRLEKQTREQEIECKGLNQSRLSNTEETENKQNPNNNMEIHSYSDEDVWEDIVRIVQDNPQGNGDQIILGELATALFNESEAYRQVKSQYKGLVRDFLRNKFGHLLKIEYINAKDVVVLKDLEYSKKASGQKKEKSKKKSDKAESDLMEASMQKPAVQDQLRKSFGVLSTDDLSAFMLMMQLVFQCCGNQISGSVLNLSKKIKTEDGNSDLANEIYNAELSLFSALIRSDTIYDEILSNNMDLIINAITEELSNRGISYTKEENASQMRSIIYQPVEMLSEVEFEGLDDWLPF